MDISHNQAYMLNVTYKSIQDDLNETYYTTSQLEGSGNLSQIIDKRLITTAIAQDQLHYKWYTNPPTFQKQIVLKQTIYSKIGRNMPTSTQINQQKCCFFLKKNYHPQNRVTKNKRTLFLLFFILFRGPHHINQSLSQENPNKGLVDIRNGARKLPIEGPKNASIPTRKQRTPTSILCQLKEARGLLSCSNGAKVCIICIFAKGNTYFFTGSICVFNDSKITGRYYWK